MNNYAVYLDRDRYELYASTSSCNYNYTVLCHHLKPYLPRFPLPPHYPLPPLRSPLPFQQPLLPQYLVRSNYFRYNLKRKWNQSTPVHQLVYLLEVAFDSNSPYQVVFSLRLKVPDGASETPVFVHCISPTRLWQ